MKLLDTPVLVDIDRGGVDRRIEKLDDEGRHTISIVSVTEFYLGINKRYEIDSDDHRNATEDLERLLSRFAVVPIDGSCHSRDHRRAVGSGESLHDLHDVYIGAAARTERLTVLTANVDHFERIDDIQVVDWNAF